MKIYLNENEPFAVAFLRVLIDEAVLPKGCVVDDRSIWDVHPSDLKGFDQCHFFAGQGGWLEAFRLAGIADARSVWSASCPCQPFSAAGQGAGFADERHLWPAFFHLVDKRRPAKLFGEQVASKLGLAWLDLVRADLEGAGYAVGAADLCAASVGAPHIRQRLWFVAQPSEPGWSAQPVGDAGEMWRTAPESGRLRDAGAMANLIGARLEGRNARALGHKLETAERSGEIGALVNAAVHGQGAGWQSDKSTGNGWAIDRGSGTWTDLEWLPCRDGKARPTQPGVQPLAYGVQNRVGTLRCAGNAIVPQVAAAFIQASLGV